jgi:hypothetical protein
VNRADIYRLIDAERDAQSAKWDRRHEWGYGDCSAPESALPPIVKSSVLAEECGEVARAVLEWDEDAQRTELVQVAAVAVAWLESL